MENEELKQKEEPSKRKNKIMLVAMLIAMFVCGMLMQWVISSLFDWKDIPSPSTRIHRSEIIVYEDKIVIQIKNPQLTGFTNTKSMDPQLDTGMKGIEVKPNSMEEIEVGDVISYHKGENRITHRVIEKGYDHFGWYLITKGDNNPMRDPFKLRWEDIDGVQVGVIY